MGWLVVVAPYRQKLKTLLGLKPYVLNENTYIKDYSYSNNLLWIWLWRNCASRLFKNFIRRNLQGQKKLIFSKEVFGPIASTSLLLESNGKCILTDWPLSSVVIIAPGGGRPKGVGQLQGEWMTKRNRGKYEIELQVRQSPSQSYNILVMTIQNFNPVELRCNIDVGSKDDFMLLEKIISGSVTKD